MDINLVVFEGVRCARSSGLLEMGHLRLGQRALRALQREEELLEAGSMRYARLICWIWHSVCQ